MNMKYFEKRKSCRKFSSVKISDDKLKEIIGKAVKAPTCGNMQLYSVIVTREKNKLEKLCNYHFNQPAATTAPVILTVCADFNRMTRWCEVSDADSGFNNFHSFITAMTDAVILTQQIVTIAEYEGFGTCYLGTVNYNAKEISELLRLPDLVVPVASISLGVPAEEGEPSERLSPDSIMHMEEYRADSDDDIRRIFRVKERYEPNKKFVEENNKQNLAQVLSEVRYPREMNEKVSETYMELLKEKRFC